MVWLLLSISMYCLSKSCRLMYEIAVLTAPLARGFNAISASAARILKLLLVRGAGAAIIALRTALSSPVSFTDLAFGGGVAPDADELGIAKSAIMQVCSKWFGPVAICTGTSLQVSDAPTEPFRCFSTLILIEPPLALLSL